MKHRIALLVFAYLTCFFFLSVLIIILQGRAQAHKIDLNQASADAPLPDLDVTYIERQPMYFAYCVEYPWGSVPGMPGNPYLCPGTENEQRWPNPGEVVTFTAHIANKGDLATSSFAYNWLIDGSIVASGSLPALAPGETITTTCLWSWAHGLVGERLTGMHTVGFSADPAGAVTESFESNNTLVDRTDAYSFQIAITPQMVLAYNVPVTSTLPRSAEDWFQKQVKAMNQALNSAVYPATPSGAVTQVRINRFVVRDTPIEGDRSHDGGWFVDADYRKVSAYYDPATDIDWAWIHEMSHQMSLIDLYMGNVEAPFNYVLNREGLRMNIGFHWPATNSIMFGGDTSPYTAPWVYDSHTAGGAKSNLGYRNGFYGAYQFDLPLHNSLLILDSTGQPASDVQVSLYRKLNLPGVPADLDNTPEISFVTLINGLLLLPNLPVTPVTLPTGHTLHANPFGMVDIVGEQNRYLVKIVKGNHEEFQWLDITPFNLAYWQGYINDYTHTIHTHLPAASAPAAPQNLHGFMESNFMTISWDPVPGQDILYNVYRMAPPDFQYVRVSGPETFTYYWASLDQPSFFLVTAVDQLGRESAFSNQVWLSPQSFPVSVVSAKDGNLLVLDNLNNHQFSVLSPSGRWLYAQPLTGYFASRFFAFNPAGLILFSQPHDDVYVYNSILVHNPQTEASFMVGGRDDSPLDNPMGVAWWGDQSYSVSGPYTLDSNALFLAHFDGSFTGARREEGSANGVTFTAGKYGQAAFFDEQDTLAYTPAYILLGRAQGTIEFWTRPTWNGDDGENHTFFEAGEAWNNGMLIIKDQASNLKLMIWDTQNHEYGVFCPVGSWKAGDWHHVAASWHDHFMMLAIDGIPCQTNLNGGLAGISIQPPTFYVGNSKYGNQPAEAAIDELRISDYLRFGNTGQLRILVADAGMDDSRIVALDGLGNLVTSFGSKGGGNNQLNDPRGLVVSPSGEVIVVDSGNNRLQVLGFDGAQFTYLRTLTGDFNAPTNAALYYGWTVVADTGNDAIKVLDPAGNLVGTYLEPDTDIVMSGIPFLGPQGVAVTPQGKIVVADSSRARVVGIAQNPLPRNRVFLPVTRK